MPPTGGQGGNKAIWDGAALGKILVDEWQAIAKGNEQGAGGKGCGSSWSKETVRRYEDSMRANTGDWVGLAGMAATYLFGGEAYWR
jgi:2-polyprenyl-6-methoxyphenol hydroxylase-like FAD-dependent oxidoreductase